MTERSPGPSLSATTLAQVRTLSTALRGLPSGIALDIDDTLSDTTAAFFESMHARFGAPAGATPVTLRSSFRYIENVPYWQHQEARDFADLHRADPSWQRTLAPLPDAVVGVRALEAVLPVRVYITARPLSMLGATQEWLRQQGFPNAAVIARPDDVAMEDAGAWKAAILAALHPAVRGIVDDNPGIVPHLPRTYPGTVILIGVPASPATAGDPRIRHAGNWAGIVAHAHSITRSGAEAAGLG